jgi:hypothetical protein
MSLAEGSEEKTARETMRAQQNLVRDQRMANRGGAPRRHSADDGSKPAADQAVQDARDQASAARQAAQAFAHSAAAQATQAIAAAEQARVLAANEASAQRQQVALQEAARLALQGQLTAQERFNKNTADTLATITATLAKLSTGQRPTRRDEEKEREERDTQEAIINSLRSKLAAADAGYIGAGSLASDMNLGAKPRGQQRSGARLAAFERAFGVGGSLQGADEDAKARFLKAFTTANNEVDPPPSHNARHPSPQLFDGDQESDIVEEMRRGGFLNNNDANSNILAGLISRSAEDTKKKTETELKKITATFATFFLHATIEGWFVRNDIDVNRSYFEINHYILMSVLHLYATRSWPVAAQYYIKLMEDVNAGHISLQQMAMAPKALAGDFKRSLDFNILNELQFAGKTAPTPKDPARPDPARKPSGTAAKVNPTDVFCSHHNSYYSKDQGHSTSSCKLKEKAFKRV